MQTRVDALLELIADSRNKRISNASMKRVERACKTLQLNVEERNAVMSALAYTDDYGSPLDWLNNKRRS